MGEPEILILSIAFVLDLVLGDPRWMPHLIVGYGNLIAFGEAQLNQGTHRLVKGGLLVLLLVPGVYFTSKIGLHFLDQLNDIAYLTISIALLFFCLANRTLIKEGVAVFHALIQEGLEAGRKRLSWIVGRETHRLDGQQIKKAVFETMSENLSDGVIAPLFYFALLGVPGAMAYKMINTLDSMIGYKNDQYLLFGRVAAKLDDAANYIPARLTALLMLIVTGKIKGLGFVRREGKKHSSPNAGYPEAALAYIVSCRLGGPNYYHGKRVEKPFIGVDTRLIEDKEIRRVVHINLTVSILFVFIIALIFFLIESS
ncbi:MAG: adenosylcobinamide-phosphate synthase CbiB [Bacteroidota bacterium]